MSGWFVYILRCADGSLYTGVTTDLRRRVGEHNGGGRSGARYTRARLPVELVYFEEVANRAEAGKREFAIRRLSKSDKEKLVGG